MAKYAPANADGLKPYSVTKTEWGKSRTKIVYAINGTDAKYKAFGRMGVGEHVTDVRRTLADDPELVRDVV